MVKKSTSKTKSKTLVLPDFSRYFLLGAVAIVLILFFWVISPFFSVLVFGALIAVIFNPLNKWLVKVFKGYRGIAAFVSTLIVIIVILLPLTLFILFTAKEAVATYQVFEERLIELDLQGIDFNKLETIPYVGDSLKRFVDKYEIDVILKESNFDVYSAVQDIAQKVTTFLVNQSATFVKNIGDFILRAMILVLTAFFFFKDGDRLRAYGKSLSPLPRKYEDAIEKKLKDTTYGMLVGTFGTAVIQGVLGGVGFAIAGVEHAVFYGTIMTFAALIPYVGSSVIWAPAAIVLMAFGPFGWGVFLALWGLIVVSNIDNLVRPVLIGSAASMHPLATFFVILGGLFVFGLKGIVFGPLILSLTLSIFHIYQMEYKEVLKTASSP